MWTAAHERLPLQVLAAEQCINIKMAVNNEEETARVWEEIGHVVQQLQ